LLGGGDRFRDKIRTYKHIKASNIQEQIHLILKAKEEGYTAVGHLNPFLDPSYDEIRQSLPFVKKINFAIEAVP